MLACVVSVEAQQHTFLKDDESLLTSVEQFRLDSLLRSYHERTGNLVTFGSDTADVSRKTYKDSVVASFASMVGSKGYSAHLFASRQHGQVELSTGPMEPLEPPRIDSLMRTITYGLDDLKAGRKEAGFTTICVKLMEFLDALPPKH